MLRYIRDGNFKPMFKALMDIGRLLKAGFVLSRHDALVPKEFEEFVPKPVRVLGKISRIGAKDDGLRPGQRLARALSGQGPAYVKFGQLLGTRPDIVGFEMAEDLGELQDRMPPFAQAIAIAEIEKNFDRPLDQIFDDFSPAVAAASVAQVHKAKLKTGEVVAVKVLRPDVERKVAIEFRAFARGAAIAERLFKPVRRMEPVTFIETIADSAKKELDLRMEAGSASEISENLASEKRVRVPDIKWDFTTKRVLTLEWIDGIKVTDTEQLEANGIDKVALSHTIMQTFLNQALNDGFFHADMHQGNLFVDEDGQLVLIDFGITGRLDEHSRRIFADIIYGFIRRDYKAAAAAHFAAGYVPPHHSVEEFATALRAVVEPIFGRDSADVDMSKVLQQLLDTTEKFEMHLRPELIMLQRTMVVMEGVTRALNPTINMWEVAEVVVRRYIDSIAGPKAMAKNAKRSAEAAFSLATKFPDFAAAAERAVNFVGDDGIKLSSQTVDDLALAIKRKKKPTR